MKEANSVINRYILTFENNVSDLRTEHILSTCIRNAVLAATNIINNKKYVLIDIKKDNGTSIVDIELEGIDATVNKC